MFHTYMNCITGGLDTGVFDGCLLDEILAYGCTGIMQCIRASGLGVSDRKPPLDSMVVFWILLGLA